MPSIDDFPSDDHLWMVKWIDKFSPFHYESRSSAVTVRLQRLPFSDPRALSQLKAADVANLLGSSKRHSAEEAARDGGDFTDCVVHVGTLPLIAIGRVYQHQQLVGELPTESRTLSLPKAEESCTTIQIGQELPKPPGWGEKYPYHILSQREFNGLVPSFGRSQCLVYLDRRSRVTYIIPRIVIFKRFYAPHTEIARAFSPGPWSHKKSILVYEYPLESGLLTQVDPQTGDWHLILQTHVPDDYCFLLALLYFDDFAKQCAERIYTNALRDRQPWYANAQIPIKSTEQPVKVSVKGFMLRDRFGPDPSTSDKRYVVVRRSFFVTAIVGVTWPTYAPPVWFERFNSGATGLTSGEAPSDLPRPYSSLRRKHNSPEPWTHIKSRTDASSEQGAYVVDDDMGEWIGQPPMLKLTKKSSKRYENHPRPGAVNDPTNDASSGMRTTQQGNPSQIRSGNPTRPPVERYKLLIQALDDLIKKNTVSTRPLVQPVNGYQTEHRDGLCCWNFFTHEESRAGDWPQAGWRLLERASRGRPSIARSALAIRVEQSGKSGIWIEIEARKSESGMVSPFLYGTDYDDHDLVDEAIQTIAACNGSGVRGALEQHFAGRDHLRVAWYTHVYGEDRKLDPDSISRFLKRIKW